MRRMSGVAFLIMTMAGGAARAQKVRVIPSFKGSGVGHETVPITNRVVKEALGRYGIELKTNQYELYGHPVGNGNSTLGRNYNRLLQQITGKRLHGQDLKEAMEFFPIEALEDLAYEVKAHGKAMALKGPTETTVQGGRSPAGRMRNLLDQYINKRPLLSLLKDVKGIPETKRPFHHLDVDLAVYRHLGGDIYNNREGRQRDGAVVKIETMAPADMERFFRGVFDDIVKTRGNSLYARRNGGKNQVIFPHKATISKIYDGTFADAYEKIAKEYAATYPDRFTYVPAIKPPTLIDNYGFKIVAQPQTIDNYVTKNFDGDWITDVMWGPYRTLGLASAINMGDKVAVAEAGHGSAPDIAGKNIVNPTATILSAASGLEFIGLYDPARDIAEAVRKTLRSKKARTPDLGGTGTATGFGDAVVRNLNEIRIQPRKISQALKVKVP